MPVGLLNDEPPGEPERHYFPGEQSKNDQLSLIRHLNTIKIAQLPPCCRRQGVQLLDAGHDRPGLQLRYLRGFLHLHHVVSTECECRIRAKFTAHYLHIQCSTCFIPALVSVKRVCATISINISLSFQSKQERGEALDMTGRAWKAAAKWYKESERQRPPEMRTH